MTRKVVRSSLEKSVVVSGGGDHALPAATSQQAGKSRCPSRVREGSKKAREGSRDNPFMPGLRIREDGWTAARTRTFLASLAQTGCVTDAARIAGMSRKSVNDARARFAEFDRACSTALARALRGLQAVAYERAVMGREMVIIRDGKEVERRIMPSDAMLGLLLKRGDLGDGAGAGTGGSKGTGSGAARTGYRRYDGDATITAEEHFQGWRFDGEGIKYFHPGSALEKLVTKLERIRAHEAKAAGDDSGPCPPRGDEAAG